MRKIIAFVILFISLVINAQGANRFSEAEDAASNNAMESSSGVMTPEGPGGGGPPVKTVEDCDGDEIPDEIDDDPCNPPNPEAPVPIDDYLPVLLITAVGIIVHAGWRKRKQTA